MNIPSIRSLKQVRKPEPRHIEQPIVYPHSKIYNVIKQECIQQILLTNDQSHSKFIQCHIPLISNDPMYSIEGCINYIQSEFNAVGYTVTLNTPDSTPNSSLSLRIDWEYPLPVNPKTSLENDSKLYHDTLEILHHNPTVEEVEYVTVPDNWRRKKKKNTTKK